MPSNYDPGTGGRNPGSGASRGDLPPELDPRRGRRPGSPSGNRPSDLPPGLDPRGRGSNTRSARRAAGGAGTRSTLAGVGIGVQIVAALLSLTVLVGSGWAWATYRSFRSNLNTVNAIPGDTNAAKNNIDGKDQNILIVGNDDRDSATPTELKQLGTTKDGGSYNTDTMMLMHVPANGSKATVISFPRDSYVSIPGHGMNKLNAAYPLGVNDGNGDKAKGAQLLVKTIENLTNLKIDHYVQVDLLGFYRISNAIGGVTVCMNHAVGPATFTGQTGSYIDSGYENGVFVKSYSGIDLKKGNNTIKGLQALAFVRQRHGLPNGDLDRIKRQQYFLSAVFRKMASAGTLLNPFKLQSLLRAVTSSLTMDSGLDPLKLAQQLQNLQAGNVKFTTIPTNGFNDNTPVGSVVVVNTSAMSDFIDSLMGTDAASALKKATAADPLTVTVSVANDTNSNDGIESKNAAALRALGFKTTLPSATSDVLAKTTIRYPSGMESQAKAVQAQVPTAVMERTGTAKGVELLLGNNGVQVKSLTPKSSSSSTAPAPSTSTSTSSSTATTVTTAADAGCIN
ncbi:LCP family protein [Jatrophihabitans telluris]|uniref:LCP family protein n=1 Tax=Jatrophihabitans telluris TaxID=2038343 RepID=A0ABY4QVT9_9ACTN|nr:LCP family protein [Jatrophihabitans telluris]UQX87563.1 LCP family protein [Jatrophihabitans telluris]